jgi:hypothetical protein
MRQRPGRDQLGERRRGSEPVHQHAAEQHDRRPVVRGRQQPARRRGVLGQCHRVGDRRHGRQRRRRRVHRVFGDVGRHQQVAGQPPVAYRGQHPVDLRGRGRRGQCRSSAGDLGVHVEEVAELPVPERVVHDPLRDLGAAGRRADHVHDGHEFGVAAGDRVDRAQFADAEGGAERGDPAHPAVAVGGVTGVELVRAAGPLDVLVRDDVVEQAERVVARYAEDAIHAELGQPVEQVVADGVGRDHQSVSPADAGSSGSTVDRRLQVRSNSG